MERLRVVAVLLLAAGMLAGNQASAAHAPQDLTGVFDRGCDLYEQGDFGAAAEHFEALITRGVRSADVYYNLGNAYYKQGNIGKAVANYKRAFILAPRDEDIGENLDLLRSIVGFRDTTAAYDLSSFAGLPLRLASPRELQIVFYIGYYLGVAAFMCALLLRGQLRRRSVQVLIALVVVAVAASVSARYGASRLGGSSEAVVTAEQTEFMSGPGNAFDELIRLPDGVEVTVRARSGLWVEVELRTGEIGWVREQNLEPI
jgi:tetratricopeptide (TPR) repeat protein